MRRLLGLKLIKESKRLQLETNLRCVVVESLAVPLHLSCALVVPDCGFPPTSLVANIFAIVCS